MQKHLYLFISILIVCILFLHCDKPPLPVRFGKVYVAGGELINFDTDSAYAIAKLWVDGKPFDLPSNTSWPQAEEVFVDKTDVYVAGSDYGDGDSRAVLWKNLRPVYLSRDGERGQGHSLFVANKDVYVSGSIYRNGAFNAVIWKNGVIVFSIPEIMHIWSLFVYNNDLYATGFHKVNGVDYPAIYKNGQPQVLQVPPNYESSEVLCVYVHKGIVYAAGYVSATINSAAVIWINGKYTELEGSGNVWATGVTVSATNDVYVTGMQNSTCVTWKNGKVLYTDKGFSSTGASIATSGKDVYVAAHGNEAILFKNNMPQVLPVKKGIGYAYSVFVK
jgi:hypothetical protein